MNFWATYTLKLTLVALLLAGLYAVGRLLRRRRFGGGNGSRSVTVVDLAMLSPRLCVYVVKVGTRHFFLGGGESSVTTLAELAPEEIDARPSSGSG